MSYSDDSDNDDSLDSDEDLPVIAMDSIRIIVPEEQLQPNNHQPITGLHVSGANLDGALPFPLDEEDPVLKQAAAAEETAAVQQQEEENASRTQRDGKNAPATASPVVAQSGVPAQTSKRPTNNDRPGAMETDNVAACAVEIADHGSSSRSVKQPQSSPAALENNDKSADETSNQNLFPDAVVPEKTAREDAARSCSHPVIVDLTCVDDDLVTTDAAAGGRNRSGDGLRLNSDRMSEKHPAHSAPAEASAGMRRQQSSVEHTCPRPGHGDGKEEVRLARNNTQNKNSGNAVHRWESPRVAFYGVNLIEHLPTKQGIHAGGDMRTAALLRIGRNQEYSSCDDHTRSRLAVDVQDSIRRQTGAIVFQEWDRQGRILNFRCSESGSPTNCKFHFAIKWNYLNDAWYLEKERGERFHTCAKPEEVASKPNTCDRRGLPDTRSGPTENPELSATDDSDLASGKGGLKEPQPRSATTSNESSNPRMPSFEVTPATSQNTVAVRNNNRTTETEETHLSQPAPNVSKKQRSPPVVSARTTNKTSSSMDKSKPRLEEANDSQKVGALMPNISSMTRSRTVDVARASGEKNSSVQCGKRSVHGEDTTQSTLTVESMPEVSNKPQSPANELATSVSDISSAVLASNRPAETNQSHPAVHSMPETGKPRSPANKLATAVNDDLSALQDSNCLAEPEKMTQSLPVVAVDSGKPQSPVIDVTPGENQKNSGLHQASLPVGSGGPHASVTEVARDNNQESRLLDDSCCLAETVEGRMKMNAAHNTMPGRRGNEVPDDVTRLPTAPEHLHRTDAEDMSIDSCEESAENGGGSPFSRTETAIESCDVDNAKVTITGNKTSRKESVSREENSKRPAIENSDAEWSHPQSDRGCSVPELGNSHDSRCRASQGCIIERHIHSSEDSDPCTEEASLVEEDDLLSSLEADLIEKLDDEITKAEERDLMESLERRILAAEEEEALEKTLYCVDDVSRPGEDDLESLEKRWKENWEEAALGHRRASRPSTSTQVLRNVDVIHANRRTMKVPKVVHRNIACFRRSDFDKMVSDFKCAYVDFTDKFSVSLNDAVGCTSSSVITVVYTNEDVAKLFFDQLKNWIQIALQRATFEHVLTRGVELTAELSSSENAGATLREHPDGFLELTVKNGGQLEGIIGRKTAEWGAVLYKVEGVRLSTTDDYLSILKTVKGTGRNKYSVSLLLSPVADLSGVKPSVSIRKLGREGVNPCQLARPGNFVRTSTGQHNSCSSAARPGTTSHDAQKCFKHFRDKMTQVAQIEFNSFGIDMPFVISRMWRNHKMVLDSYCDQDCRCVFDLSRLVDSVAKEAIEQQRTGDSMPTDPVGFTSSFAGNFMGMLANEYPSDNPQQLLVRLVKMWKLHRKTRNFGIRCSSSCDCPQGWELVFDRGSGKSTSGKKGKTSPGSAAVDIGDSKVDSNGPATRKRKLAESNPSNNSQLSIGDHIPKSTKKAKIPAKALLGNLPRPSPGCPSEFSLLFDCAKPLGFFCETARDQTPFCKIISVCPDPRSQAAQEPRIQLGTRVVGAAAPSEPRVNIGGYKHLSRLFHETRASDKGRHLWLWFANTAATCQSGDPKSRHQNDWNSNCLFLRNGHVVGWDGGANELFEEAGSHHRTDNENGVEVNSTRSSATHEPVSFPGRNHSGDACASKQMDLSNSEERRYNPDKFLIDQANEMSHREVTATSPTPNRSEKRPEMFLEAIRTKPFGEVLRLFESGKATEVGAEQHFHELRKEVKRALSRIDLQPTSGHVLEKRCLVKKDKLLSFLINATRAAKVARSLWSDSVKFRIRLLGIDPLHVIDCPGAKEISVSVAAVVDETTKELKPPFSPIPLGAKVHYHPSEPYEMAFYPKTVENRAIQIGLKLVFENAVNKIKLASAVIPLSKFHAVCPAMCPEEYELDQQLSRSQFLRKATLKLKVRHCAPHQHPANETKRAAEIKRINDVIDWTRRFNDDLNPREREDCSISQKLFVRGGISLLHSAVLLEDLELVKRLINCHVDPQAPSVIGSATQLATKIREILRTDLEGATGSAESNEEGKNKRDRLANQGRILRALDQSARLSQASPTVPPDIAGDGQAPASGHRRDQERGPLPRKNIPEVRVSNSQANQHAKNGSVTGGMFASKTSSSSTVDPKCLPKIDNPSWLQEKDDKPCHFYDNPGSCRNGRKCRFWHIQSKPLGELLHENAHIKLVSEATDSSFSAHRSIEAGKDSNGRRWWTAGFRNDINKEIFYAEGGTSGVRSRQNVWWYPDVKDAEKALKTVMSVVTTLNSSPRR